MTHARLRAQQAHDLQDALHQTTNLYARTHLAHWNVEGPSFPQLHLLFESQYNELWQALDTIAERLRTLGAHVDASAFSAVPQIPERARDMVRELAKEHRRLAAFWRTTESNAADAADPATADLATGRIAAHDQQAWMLEATSKQWDE